jgi:hypothetical protein
LQTAGISLHTPRHRLAVELVGQRPASDISPIAGNVFDFGMRAERRAFGVRDGVAAVVATVAPKISAVAGQLRCTSARAIGVTRLAVSSATYSAESNEISSSGGRSRNAASPSGVNAENSRVSKAADATGTAGDDHHLVVESNVLGPRE